VRTMTKIEKIKTFNGKKFYLFNSIPYPSRAKAEEARKAWAFQGMGYNPEFRIVKCENGFLLYYR